MARREQDAVREARALMFAKSRYIEYLESQIQALQKRETILLSALLDRIGSPEAANMLRGQEKAVTDDQVKESGKRHYEAREITFGRSGWRTRSAELSRATVPATQATDSIDKLEQRTGGTQ